MTDSPLLSLNLVINCTDFFKITRELWWCTRNMTWCMELYSKFQIIFKYVLSMNILARPREKVDIQKILHIMFVEELLRMFVEFGL